MSRLVLVRGLPGSGKSTFIKSIPEPKVHLEADMYFINRDGEYVFDASKLRDAHEWCQARTELYLSDINSLVFVSNTFTTKKELRPYFEIAKKYGIIPSVILMQNQFKNVHNVPQETMDRMKARFEYDISDLFK